MPHTMPSPIPTVTSGSLIRAMGSLMHYEGNRGELALKEAVYRIDPHTGALTLVTDTLAKPNGLCFSPDYQKLYIVDTGVTHNPDHPREITVWEVVDGQRLR